MKLPTLTSILGLSKSEDASEKKEFDPKELGPKKILYTWESMSRPSYKDSNLLLNKNLIVIYAVLGLILVIMQEFIPIFLVGGLIFISYVLSNTAPEKITHEISTHGFSYAGHPYYWNELQNFFFSEDVSNLLIITTYELLPGRLFILVDPKDKDKIKDFMINHLNFLENEPKSYLDKAYKFISNKFNIVGTSKSK